MKISERFEPRAAEAIREAIREAGDSEVMVVGRLGGSGRIDSITIAARGHDEAVPVLQPFVDGGDVVIHNHPSGQLKPSSADLQVAARLGNEGIGFYIVDNPVESVYVVAEPFLRREVEPLRSEDLAALLSDGGALSRLHSSYEERPAQVDMLRQVCEAFNEGRLLTAEAGTGVGKSLAYLIPAFAWVMQNEERVVISTATINLQQQLIDQDIPMVRRLFGRAQGSDPRGVATSNPPGVALVKGRSNYLCLTRLDESVREFTLFEEEDQDIRAILEWSATTPSGSRSDLPFYVHDEVWYRVCSESDACRGLRCPERERCFVLKARREAAAARLLIVNHHLLFSDLSVRAMGAGFDGAAVLPPFHRIVFDEAHNIENSATSFFSTGFHRLGIGKYIGRLYRRKRGRTLGLLPGLERMTGAREGTARIREALDRVEERAQTLETLAWQLLREETSLLVRPDAPPEGLSAMLLEPMDELSRSIGFLLRLFEDLLDGLGEEERESGLVYECRIELRRLSGVAEVCDRFQRCGESREQIFWLETQRSFRGDRYLRFVITPLEIAALMRDSVYRPFATVVFTSATLTVNRSFEYWKGRVGLRDIGDRECAEGLFASPFDYRRNVLLGIPEDAPTPETPEYPAYVPEVVRELLKVSEGRALVLFTSYSSLRETHAQVSPFLEDMGIQVYRQGSEDRSRLLTRFREDTSSVLFATDSFWEGVDAPGEALELVILCRLPFRVPSEPIIAARMDAIRQRGGNPFQELSLPDAVMRFKQGFGRLMRRKTDFGAVIILDSRVIRKYYGKLFLFSLPETRREISPGFLLLESMGDFFREMRKK